MIDVRCGVDEVMEILMNVMMKRKTFSGAKQREAGGMLCNHASP